MPLAKHNRTFSILGILGGVIFFIGDALLFLTPNFQMETDARMDWPTMPLWRFGASAICGIAGMVLLFFGVAAMYHALCNEEASSKIKGLWITVKISFLAAILTFIIGIIIALMRLSSFQFLKDIATVYVTVIRGTPLLVQIFLFYFIVANIFELDSFIAGVLSLGIFIVKFESIIKIEQIEVCPN